MKKYKKTFDLRRGKLNVSYTVEEITEHLGITKGTVYRWIKEGLAPIDQKHPYLFQGKGLKSFLKERQSNRKWKCNIIELPCLKCQRPSKALEGKAWIKFSKKTYINLTAHCEVCQRKMFKCVSMKQLPEIRKHMLIVEQQQSHIVGGSNTACIDSKKKSSNTYPILEHNKKEINHHLNEIRITHKVENR